MSRLLVGHLSSLGCPNAMASRALLVDLPTRGAVVDALGRASDVES